MKSRSAAFALAALLCCAPASAQVTTPEGHLGRKPGADFQLADWKEVSGYFKTLAAQSPRVKLDVVGTTTEGREFLLAAISSEKNLADLPRQRRLAAQIADPRSVTDRAALLREAKLTLFVSCAMHSTETAAPQFAMEFAHRLATSDAEPWKSARENTIVLLAPTLNPDGLDEVVRWYRKTVNTPHEGTGLTRLYQLYAGHDNNRDWFALTQAETRIVTRLLYHDYHPQVYWDVHQQGGTRERFFVPPFRDPLNPNLDPGIITGIDALGSRALHDMTREGLSGVSTGVTYDMWWNGGNRNVPVRHNIIGILTEAASVNLASPVFLRPSELKPPRGLPSYGPSNRFPKPWPGGWWRLRDIIDYELAFGRSLLGSLSREREAWLGNSFDAAQRALDRGLEEAPRAWLIPSDNLDRGATRRLVETLLLGGVGIHVSPGILKADGRAYPPGTLVILRHQPYGAHVKDLFEVQRYPEGEPPYDVSGWTLPLLFGVRRVEVTGFVQPEQPLKRIGTAAEALAGFGSEEPTRVSDSDTWTRVFSALKSGQALRLRTQGEQAGTFELAEGEPPEGALTVKSVPRIGIYSPWRGIKNEGWLRWVLEQAGVPYVRMRDAMLRAGKLKDVLDVLIVPSMSPEALDAGRTPGSVPSEFAGGLAPEGAVAIEEFVRGGGTLIALDRAGDWAKQLLELPVEDVTRPAEGEESEGPAFSCPGSVLRTVPETSPLTAGLPSSLAVFFSRSKAWREVPAEEEEESRVEVLLRYAPTRTLLSGWIQKPEVIAGQGAWLRIRHGEGRVHLFGFRPQYRGWSQAAFQLLYRAALLDGRR